jgi:hypothetical protein
MVAGLHVPVIPLLDVVGSVGAVLFWQSGPIAVNDGVICGSMVMLSVATVAHSPLAGVNVYVIVPGTDVLMVAGLQVPFTPLLDVAGRVCAAEFWHSGPIALNVGVSCGSMVMLSVAVVAHSPADGVNVYVVVPAVAVLIVAGLQVPVIPLLDVVGSVGAVLF